MNNSKKQPLIRTVGGVLSAFIGVQSKKKRIEDFKTGNIYIYAVFGFLATILFVAALGMIAVSAAGVNAHTLGVGTLIVAV